MSNPSKIGVVLAAAVGTALLALGGCASQGSGAATPQNLPENCASYAQNSCKNQATCKTTASCHSKKKHHSKVKTTAAKTTTTTETSTETK